MCSAVLSKAVLLVCSLRLYTTITTTRSWLTAVYWESGSTAYDEELTLLPYELNRKQTNKGNKNKFDALAKCDRLCLSSYFGTWAYWSLYNIRI